MAVRDKDIAEACNRLDQFDDVTLLEEIVEGFYCFREGTPHYLKAEAKWEQYKLDREKRKQNAERL